MGWLDAGLAPKPWEVSALAAVGGDLSRLRFIVAALAAVPLNAAWRLVPGTKGACGGGGRGRGEEDAANDTSASPPLGGGACPPPPFPARALPAPTKPSSRRNRFKSGKGGRRRPGAADVLFSFRHP